MPANGPAWIRFTDIGVEAVGSTESLILIANATYLAITMLTPESLETVCLALAGQ